MRIQSLFGVAALCLFWLTCPGSSLAEVRQGIEVTIAKDEVIEDDLYVFAQTATVDGTIQGDLIFFGQQITLKGSVEGDLIAAAQQIAINGSVADDARLAGQIIAVQDNARITDDLIAASYSLECTSASRVGGEVKVAGYQTVMAGRIEKKVEIASANCKLSGSFGDDVNVAVEGRYGPAGYGVAEFPTIPLGLTITDSANIEGDLIYVSTSEAAIEPGSTIVGEVEHQQTDSDTAEPPTLADRVLSVVQKFFALLLIGLIFVFICPRSTGQVVDNIQRRPLASFGWGLLTFIGVITGVILLLVATIATAVLLGFASMGILIPACLGLGLLSTAAAAIGLWLYSAWGSQVVVGIWAGNRLLHGPDWRSKRRFLTLALGVLLCAVVMAIPYVGTALFIVVMLMGLGSTALWMLGESQTGLNKRQPKHELLSHRSES